MFTGKQVEKIQFFASMTKITNECFVKCVEFNKDENISSLQTDLSPKEEDCIKSCAENYVKLREFVETQLFKDYEFIKNKNKKIFDEES